MFYFVYATVWQQRLKKTQKLAMGKNSSGLIQEDPITAILNRDVSNANTYLYLKLSDRRKLLVNEFFMFDFAGGSTSLLACNRKNLMKMLVNLWE